jgi:hypothetical protein
VKTSDVFGRMTVQYGGNFLDRMKVNEWVQRFKQYTGSTQGHFLRCIKWVHIREYAGASFPPPSTSKEEKEMFYPQPYAMRYEKTTHVAMLDLSCKFTLFQSSTRIPCAFLSASVAA